MSVSTVNGWTNITLPQDARAVYVSSSAGDDANAGFSESSPVRTLTKAVSLMRQYFGDHLLLKRGDVWNESLGMWGARGGGADQVSVVSGYGSGPRPLLQTTDSAFRIHNGTAWHTLRSSGCT